MGKNIAIVGAGSAGLLTAAHLCTWLDLSWRVMVVHDPNKKTLGIGESTNGAFVSVLERGTNFSVARREDLEALDATIKYGSKFSGWRQEGWVNPLLSGNIAIHFNSQRFKHFIFERLSLLWPQQFAILEADVRELQNFTDHVRISTDKGTFDFDFVVDCRGTPTSFDGYTLSDCTLIDRCLVHTAPHYQYKPFTDHIATPDGWMFGVPLASGKTYGYLYSQQHVDDQQAAENLRRLLKVEELETGSYDQRYQFQCYYANELVSGRVAKNGNRALFFEPLLANSMFLYIYAARLIYDRFVSGREAQHCNNLFSKALREVEDVISYYYKGGSTFESDFWKQAAEKATTRLGKRTEFQDYVRKVRDFKANGTMYAAPSYAFSPHTWSIVDAALGYRSFDSE